MHIFTFIVVMNICVLCIQIPSATRLQLIQNIVRDPHGSSLTAHIDTPADLMWKDESTASSEPARCPLKEALWSAAQSFHALKGPKVLIIFFLNSFNFSHEIV